MIQPWSRAEQRAIVDAGTILVAEHGHTDRATRVEGALWYPDRLSFCARLWPEHPERVALVLAVTSARTSWVVNQAYTTRVVGAYLAGQQCPAVGTISMRTKAWRAVAGEDPESVIPRATAPKTSDFYRAIMGDTSVAVIDRWAARAAGWDLPDNQGIRPRKYRLLSEAYVLAAHLLNVSPRYLQATLWIAKRGSGD